MPVHIKEINAKHLGPLVRFQLKPARVNLIYAPNEKGKTHLVEFLIRSLFRKDKTWTLRQQDGGGTVTVTGLGSGRESFSPGSAQKIEDFWEQSHTGLPADYSRLLVVKGGISSLDGSDAGAGKTIVKKYLSNQQIYAAIEQRISKTVQTASVEGGTIIARNQGENKNRELLAEQLTRIQDLFGEIDRRYSGGRRVVLAAEEKTLQAKIEEQVRAGQHQAYTVSRHIEELEEQLLALPAELIHDIKSDIRLLRQKQEDLAAKTQLLQQAEDSSRHHVWLADAVTHYEDLLLRRSHGPGLVLPLICGAGLAGAAASVLLSVTWAALVSLGVSLTAGLLLFLNMRRSLQNAPGAEERRRLEAEFEIRFTRPLSDLSQLREMRAESVAAAERCRLYRDQLAAEKRTAADIRQRLREHFFSLCAEQMEPEHWEETVSSAEKREKELTRRLGDARITLARLGVDPADYIADPVPAVYSERVLSGLQEELARTRERTAAADQDLKDLKRAVFNETLDSSADSWEAQINALREKQRRLSGEMRLLTADIIGQNIVYNVLTGLQQSEDGKIAEALASPDIGRILSAMTGRYTGLELRGDDILVTDGFEQFTLSDLSTGAREQVLLALRCGFAGRLAGGSAMFLILDDAFQHSDWERRRLLVRQILQLAQQDWQIFYFTMDDHIRSLFLKEAEILGEDFRLIDLHQEDV